MSKNGLKISAVLVFVVGMMLLVNFLTVAAESGYKFPAANKPYAGTTLNVTMVGEPKPIALIQYLPEFEEATGIKVNFEVLPYGNLQEKQLIAVTQGAGTYDMVHVDGIWMGQYAGHGLIIPVDSFVEQTDPEVLDFKDFLPTCLSEFCAWDSKLYGLPFDTCVVMLYYRTDLLEKYNLKVPTTWDELYRAAKIITDNEKQNNVYGLTLMAKRGVQLQATYATIFGSYGGYYYDENYQATLNSMAALESLKMLNKLISVSNPGCLAQDYDELNATFSNGNAAMAIQYNDSIPSFKDPSQSKIVGKWSVATLPGTVVDGKLKIAALLGGWNMGILSDSKNKEAAWEFQLWATSKEMETRLAVAQPPSRRSVLVALANQYPEYVPMLESFDTGWGRPRIDKWTEMSDAIETALSQAVTGETTPEIALENAQQQENQILLRGGYQK